MLHFKRTAKLLVLATALFLGNKAEAVNLTIKFLTGQVINIDTPTDATTTDIKEIIYKKIQEIPTEIMRIIHNGKELNNYKICDFLQEDDVLFVAHKPKNLNTTTEEETQKEQQGLIDLVTISCCTEVTPDSATSLETSPMNISTKELAVFDRDEIISAHI